MPENPNHSPANESCSADRASCGSCGGPGLCPGIALLAAYVVGAGIVYLTGFEWLGWTVGIPLGLVLLTGAWRFLPWKKQA